MQRREIRLCKGAAISKPRKHTVQIEIAPLSIVKTLLIVAGAWILFQLIPVLLVLVASLMLVGTLNPAVTWLEHRGLGRRTSIGIVFGLLLCAMLLFLTLTVPAFVEQIKSLIQQEPQLRARIVEFLSRHEPTASFAHTLQNFKYETLITSSGAQVLAFSKSAVEVLAYTAGAFFLALYIMLDRDRLRGALFAVVPRVYHIRLSRILLQLETIVGGYLRGQFITCLLMGMFVFALLLVCGVPNALAIAVFGGIADVLPFIGPVLTIVPAVFAAFVKGPAIAITVLVALLCYEELESRFLIPLVYGRALRLPSSVVLFSLILGGALYGIVGALLALPTAATILMLVEELRIELPGESPPEEELRKKHAEEERQQVYLQQTEHMPVDQAAAVAVEISDPGKSAGEDPASR